MSQLGHDAWVPSLATNPATETPTVLRVVPDLPRALGEDLLAPESSLDQQVVVRRRVQVTPDVVTLVLEPTAPTAPGAFAFRPGQYLTLTVEVDGVPVERCYTISSPPSRPHLLTITVKRIEGGVLSPYLHDRLVVGDRLDVRGPMGDFTVADHPAAGYLLLSAGSGITPTLSTLRTMADLGELGGPDGADVVVVHSARTPADLACRAELEALATTHDGLWLLWVCEGDAPGMPAWTGARGRVSADLLREAVPDLAERQVFTCGPPGYMEATRTILATLGLDPARCHEESFVIGTEAAPGPLELVGPVVEPAVGPVVGAPVAAPGTATVRFGRSGREVACAPGTTVLQAAREAGVNIPSSCGTGLCGTCKSGLLSGRVEMNHQGGIRPREIAQDKFLPCCSTPDGDVVVDA